MIRILFQFPNAIQRLYKGVVWRIKPDRKTDKKVIYLTFDDGCIPEVTPQVLNILKKYDVKATFFCVGDNIRKYPEIYRRILSEGHQTGNHTYHHIAGLQTSTADYLKDVAMTDSIMEEASQIPSRHLFRPPYGRMRYSQKKALLKTHKIVLWDLLTHDYNKRYSPEKIMRVIKRYSRNGSIVVFHDSLKACEQMLPTLPKAIEFWQNEGYQLSVISL